MPTLYSPSNRCATSARICRRAHDDAKATGKVLLGFSLAAAASSQMPTALALLMVSELSRLTSLWFENFDVKFDR